MERTSVHVTPELRDRNLSPPVFSKVHLLEAACANLLKFLQLFQRNFTVLKPQDSKIDYEFTRQVRFDRLIRVTFIVDCATQGVARTEETKNGEGVVANSRKD